jgi:hypothetical protein
MYTNLPKRSAAQRLKTVLQNQTSEAAKIPVVVKIGDDQQTNMCV